jgi:hypothetical protein
MSLAAHRIAPLFIAPALVLALGTRAAADESCPTAATAPAGTTLTPVQFEQLHGGYRLQDGSLLWVSGRPLLPKVSIDGAEPRPMRALSPQTLSSADGSIVLRFSNLEDGVFKSVHLSRGPADAALAQAGR